MFDCDKEVINLDLETTGFGTYTGDKIFSFSITTKNIETKVYRFDNVDKAKNNESHRVFKKYTAKDYYTIIAHNAKFEQGFTAMYHGGVLPPSQWHDTLMMSRMLKNLMKVHKLEVLCDKYFSREYPEKAAHWKEIDLQVKKHMLMQERLLTRYPKRVRAEILKPMYSARINPLVTNKANYGLIPVGIMHPYQVNDGDRGMLLYHLMYPKLIKDERLFQDYLNEMELIRNTQYMEQTGIMVHTRNARKLEKELGKKLEKVVTEKKKIFGFDINLSSSDQTSKHFFGYINKKKHEKLNMNWKIYKPVFNLKSVKESPKTGAPSLDKDVLEELQKEYPENPAIDIISQWRAFSLGHTMVESYPELMSKDKIIHASINTNQAATGRQSVSKPGLQGTQKGSTYKKKYSIPARKCFRPRPGYVFFMGDYSGEEMRLIINASGEKTLMDRLKADHNFDVHTFNMEAMFTKEYVDTLSKEEKKDLRNLVKEAGFCLVYGDSLKAFARALQVSISKAKVILERYMKVCPNICTYNRRQREKVQRDGYVTSAFGRRLSIYRSEAYTKSANYQIQGDAAGILKRAQNNIAIYLREVWNNEIKMILPVHDEIIFEFPKYLMSQHVGILHDLSWCMTNISEIEVPLMIEWKIGVKSWGEAEEIEI